MPVLVTVSVGHKLGISTFAISRYDVLLIDRGYRLTASYFRVWVLSQVCIKDSITYLVTHFVCKLKQTCRMIELFINSIRTIIVMIIAGKAGPRAEIILTWAA